MRIALDTNILVHYLNQRDPRHRPVVTHLEAMAAAGAEPMLSPQNLYEVWVTATRPVDANGMGISPQETRDHINRLLQSFDLIADPADIWRRWLDLCTTHSIKGKRAHDARLVAWMLGHGIDQLVTFNAGDFAAFGGIKKLSPNSV